MEHKEEIEKVIKIVKKGCDLLLDLIPGLDSPICMDQTIEEGEYTVRIILDHK